LASEGYQPPVFRRRELDEGKLQELDADGFTMLTSVFCAEEIDALTVSLAAALENPSDSVLKRHGIVYASRNVLELWPQAGSIWRRHPLTDLLIQLLGKRMGLVRALFFDKPPEETWSLPWHKDLTIAVRDNQLPTSRFRNPTTKAGVPHVEAYVGLLENMATARIHFDEVDENNGPLRVVPGSHRAGKAMTFDESMARTLSAQRGDVLVIRPLVAHCSLPSAPDAKRHRRILHLEFAGTPDLPDGYAWHNYIDT
jgi:hypothetical protein